MRRIISLFIFTSFVLLTWHIIRNYRINSIACVSQFTKCNSDILSSIDKIKKEDVFTTRKNINRVLKDNPLVKIYSLQLKINGKYIIHIEERIPKYCIKGAENNYYSDSDGLIIKIDKDGTIKCVEENNVIYHLGNKLNQKDFFILKVFFNIRNIVGLENAYIGNDNLIVEYKGKIKLIFPMEGDPKSLAGKAYYTASQFDKIEEYIIGMGNILVSEVDFRFINPIVRFI
jgi:hypothetical protein